MKPMCDIPIPTKSSWVEIFIKKFKKTCIYVSEIWYPWFVFKSHLIFFIIILFIYSRPPVSYVQDFNIILTNLNIAKHILKIKTAKKLIKLWWVPFLGGTGIYSDELLRVNLNPFKN